MHVLLLGRVDDNGLWSLWLSINLVSLCQQLKSMFAVRHCQFLVHVSTPYVACCESGVKPPCKGGLGWECSCALWVLQHRWHVATTEAAVEEAGRGLATRSLCCYGSQLPRKQGMPIWTVHLISSMALWKSLAEMKRRWERGISAVPSFSQAFFMEEETLWCLWLWKLLQFNTK